MGITTKTLEGLRSLVDQMRSELSHRGLPPGGNAGDVLTKTDFVNYHASWGSGSGSVLPTRTSSSYTTANLSAGASENGFITLATGFRLIGLSVDNACRVQLYQSVADRTADLSRNWGTNPAPGVGLALDYLTVGAFSAELSPESDGFSTESTPTTSIPLRITATLGGIVNLTLTWIKTEGP